MINLELIWENAAQMAQTLNSLLSWSTFAMKQLREVFSLINSSSTQIPNYGTIKVTGVSLRVR